jgi:hypothetical protein
MKQPDSQHYYNRSILLAVILISSVFGPFMSSVDKRTLGTAAATLGTMRLTGQMFSMAIAAMAIHLFIGDSKISLANSDGFMQSLRVIFLIFAVLCFTGIFASLARGKRLK